MNKKGFTLIEILAVIVILAVVMLIGTVSVTGIKAKMQRNMFESKLDLIIGGAKAWGQDNKSEISPSNSSNVGDRYIEDLIELKYIDTEEVARFSDYNACLPQNKIPLTGTPEKCKNVITNNIIGVVINKLSVRVYLDHNRVYACIINDSSTRGTKNKALLKDESGALIDSDYYCS